MRRLLLFYQMQMKTPSQPADVARVIHEATTTDEPKLRYLVGQDAEGIGGLKKQLDDGQFEQTMRQALDFWD